MNTDKTKERPILFSGPMVRAILNGTKTQTRRVVNPQPSMVTGAGGADCTNRYTWPDKKSGTQLCEYPSWANPQMLSQCHHGKPGDRLWVRETFQYTGPELNIDPGYVYRATDPDWSEMEGFTWKPSIFMPRAVSRILLEITSVRVERVQDITEEDAKAEGIKHGMDAVYASALLEDKPLCPARREFMLLWDTLNAKRGFGWDENPWVWVITFKKITPTSTL